MNKRIVDSDSGVLTCSFLYNFASWRNGSKVLRVTENKDIRKNTFRDLYIYTQNHSPDFILLESGEEDGEPSGVPDGPSSGLLVVAAGC